MFKTGWNSTVDTMGSCYWVVIRPLCHMPYFRDRDRRGSPLFSTGPWPAAPYPTTRAERSTLWQGRRDTPNAELNLCLQPKVLTLSYGWLWHKARSWINVFLTVHITIKNYYVYIKRVLRYIQSAVVLVLQKLN